LDKPDNRRKRVTLILLLCAGILLVPLIAMQFTTEVDWTLQDFLVAAILLFGAGIGIELTLGFFKTRASRIIVMMLILIGVLSLWIQLAIGFF
jgi:hypothetical protein